MRSLAELDDSSIRIIAESDPGDIAIYELADGKLLPLFTADGLAEFSGMDKEEYDEVIRQDATVLILEVDRDTVASLIDKVLRDGEDEDCTYRVVNRDEGFIWVHARGRIIGSRNGHPVLMVSYSRTSSEAAALSQLLDFTSSIVYVIDKDSYELLFANRVALGIWGHGDFIGQPCYRYINDCSEPCPWCSVPLMQDGFCHFDAVCKPDDNMWFAIDCHDIDWHGRAAIAISARDVTEQELRRQGVERDRDVLESILGHIPGGVALFSERDGEIRLDYTNAGFYEVHPGPREHWVSLGPDPVKWLAPEDRHIFEDELNAVVSEGKPQGDATYRVVDGQGRYHWVNNRFRNAYEREGIRYFYASFTNLDEQKAAEASMNEAYRMYEQAVEEAKLVVWEYDIPNHRVVMSENEFTRYDYRKFGLPKVTENAPQSLLPYIDDEYVEDFLEMYRQVDEGAPTATCEVWYKMKPETEPRCEKISYTTVFDEEGRPIKAYGIGQNITAQKAAEKRYESAFERLAAAHPHSLGSFHLNLTRNWCGEGISPLDFVLKQQSSGTVDGYFAEFAKLIADEDVRKWFFGIFDREKLLEAFHEGKTEVSFEYPIVYEDGVRHWREGLLYMIPNPITGDVEAVTYAIDIDARKHSERIIELLTSSELDYFGLIHPTTHEFELMGTGSIDIDMAMDASTDYESCCRRIGESFIAERDRAAFAAAVSLRNVLDELGEKGELTVPYVYEEGGSQKRKHLRYRWLENVGGDILVTQLDVTSVYAQEQERMRQLQEAAIAAERASQAEQAFLSNMSHDMRTPLNGIIGFTELAKQTDDVQRLKDYLGKIDASSKLMLDLVNDVLDMSKIESGKMELRPQAFESQGLFNSIIDSIRLAADARGISLLTDYDREYPRYILADRLRLQQIVLNLLSNAIKYTPDGGTVTFGVGALEAPVEGCNTLIRIADNGIGMSTEFQKRMFDPFAQEHQSRMYGTQGTGLGLSIAGKIVKIMGGHIDVDSTLGKGSEFKVYLPIESVELGEATSDGHASAQTDIAGIRVLLCEDNDLNAEIAETILRERGGVEVERAVDGEVGLEMFVASPAGYYDAVLMDIRMPKKDGYKTATAIRNLDRADAATVPIVAMTADAFAEDIQRSHDAGMVAHISKPIDPMTLINTLGDVLGQV